jgi:hypothetical protein
MANIWEEREKALENQYFYKKDKAKLEEMKEESREQFIRDCCHGRCPKCGEQLQALNFRGVPLDKCPSCGGVWLGPKDLQILSRKDHRTWFDRWFKGEE